MSPRDVPVTVVGGFLGAGKTTLVNQLIASLKDLRVGVLVNDFGELSVDARSIVAAERDVVSLANGCICCSVRGSVLGTVYRLLERPDAPEHLLVEASGVSDPRSLADLFLDAQRTGAIRLDALISVVDAEGFDPSDSLMRAQVQTADLAVLNKVDLVSEARLCEVRDQVQEIAPHARRVETVQARLPLDVLLGVTPRPHETSSERIDAEDRFIRFTYRCEVPRAYRTFIPALTSLPAAVLRAKGSVDLVEREGEEVQFQLVGRRLWVKTLGPWSNRPRRTELAMIARRGEITPEEIADLLDA